MRPIDSEAKIREAVPALNAALMSAKLKEYSARIGVPRHRANGPRRAHHPARGDEMPKGRRGRSVCSVRGCEKQMLARGWCPMHYSRWRLMGDAEASTERSRTLIERFWVKVTKDDAPPRFRPDLDPCWRWNCANPQQYGSFWDTTGYVPAHRWSYEHFVGPIPDALHIDHLCRLPACVNPAHLEPVTCAENLRRGIGTELICKVGQENPAAKLTEDKVREIRRLYATGVSQSELGRRFGVSRRNISFVVTRRTWSEV